MPGECFRGFVPDVRVVATEEEIMQLDSSERQQRVLEAVIGLICGLARRTPIVVAVEDTHWIDPTSEALLSALAARTGLVSVLFLCTHRPGYTAPWLQTAKQIAITPLSQTESEQFISAALGPAATNNAVLGLVRRKLREILCSCRSWLRAVSSGGHDGGLPGTVQAVLMSRIDRLPRAARSLLQIASVLGREFHLRLVEQLWNNAERLDYLLNELMRLQLIYERIEVDERILVFSHALVQDAAYESLLKSRRQEMHRQAAQAIEKLFPGSVRPWPLCWRIIMRAEAMPRTQSVTRSSPPTAHFRPMRSPKPKACCGRRWRSRNPCRGNWVWASHLRCDATFASALPCRQVRR